MANLAGMYPTGIPGKDYPSNKQWPSHWTPIPIHTVEQQNDFVILYLNNYLIPIRNYLILILI